MENLFIKAVKQGYRFQSTQGLLTVEDLYRLPLQSQNKASLDSVARTLYADIKEGQEVSFVEPTLKDTELSEKLEIVKFIIKDKQEDNKAQVDAVQKKQEKLRLQQLLQNKVQAKDAELSVEELQAKIAAL